MRFGISGVRVAMPPFDSPYTYTQDSALIAKSLSMRTYWGVSTGTMNNDETRWTAFLNSIDAHAQFAYTNGLDCFMIGNEEEMKTSLDPARIVADLKAKAQEVRATYPGMKLMMSTDQGNMSRWLDDDAFDYHGYNIYGPGPQSWSSAISLAASDPRAVVTEWNTADGLNDTTMGVNGDMTVWGDVLHARRDDLNAAGLEHFIFAMRGGGFGIDDRWSMWVGDERRPVWARLY